MPAPDIRYVPHAIVDADAALARLDDEIAWLDTMRARRTASFGLPYNYSGQIYPALAMPNGVRAIAVCASKLAGHSFDNCLCNLYETGARTMGFHSDSYAELEPESFIAIASLGATRTLTFRSTDRVHRASYPLEHGSILLMDRATQLAWEHAVLREPTVGRRLSLTFRRFRA